MPQTAKAIAPARPGVNERTKMIFDEYLSKEEVEELKENIRAYNLRWKHRTFWFGMAFLVSIALNVPFAAGNSLHAYQRLGDDLTWVAEFFLIATTLSAAFWWTGWNRLREVERLYS